MLFIQHYTVSLPTKSFQNTVLTTDQYIFTLGLAISAILDILVTGTLCYYLRRGRDGFAR